MYFVDYKHLKFNNWYIYPDWAYVFGWTIALTTFVVLILTVTGQMCQTSGTFMQVSVEILLPARILIICITMALFWLQRLSFLCRPAEEPVLRGQAATEDQGATEMTPCDI